MKVSRRRKTEQRCVGNQFGQGRDRVGFDLDDRGRQAMSFEYVVDPLTQSDSSGRQNPLRCNKILDRKLLAAKRVILGRDDHYFVDTEGFVHELLFV